MTNEVYVKDEIQEKYDRTKTHSDLVRIVEIIGIRSYQKQCSWGSWQPGS